MTPYTKQIVELHKIHKAIENCGCNKDDEQGGGDNGNFLMSLIPNQAPKPDLFLVSDINKDNNVDVTNYKIDDLINLCVERDGNLQILCLYESSNLNPTIVNKIIFGLDPSSNIILSINSIFDGPINTKQINYNNKVYYYYYFKEQN